jgi:hypothetical protein
MANGLPERCSWHCEGGLEYAGEVESKTAGGFAPYFPAETRFDLLSGPNDEEC